MLAAGAGLVEAMKELVAKRADVEEQKRVLFFFGAFLPK
jgi:hypothetical protein